jgi:hypothetical protein
LEASDLRGAVARSSMGAVGETPSLSSAGVIVAVVIAPSRAKGCASGVAGVFAGTTTLATAESGVPGTLAVR